MSFNSDTLFEIAVDLIDGVQQIEFTEKVCVKIDIGAVCGP